MAVVARLAPLGPIRGLGKMPSLVARRGGLKRGRARGGDAAEGLDPALEVAVPAEQRPVNELARLKKAQLGSWALLKFPEYEKRFGAVWLAFFVLVGAPVASQTFNPMTEALQFFSSASLAACLAVGAAAIRLYLVWSYVGTRLMSATVEYEETGWYDGQIFVKPPEVLTRDRLLGTYEVRLCSECLALIVGKALCSTPRAARLVEGSGITHPVDTLLATALVQHAFAENQPTTIPTCSRGAELCALVCKFSWIGNIFVDGNGSVNTASYAGSCFAPWPCCYPLPIEPLMKSRVCICCPRGCIIPIQWQIDACGERSRPVIGIYVIALKMTNGSEIPNLYLSWFMAARSCSFACQESYTSFLARSSIPGGLGQGQ
eukprot:evm.model.scf_213EXC.3 EVM.evm.TU.scf_213EXC.3   scf_213EXC:44727-48958(+)